MASRFRLLSLLLALVLLLSAAPLALASCDNTPAGDETTVPDESTAAPVVSRTTFELVKDGVCNVKVIRPDESATNSIDVLAAQTIREALEDTSGVSVGIGTDWVKPNDSHDPDAMEILVGITSYEESGTAAADLHYGDYSVSVVGNKIVVLGFTESALSAAVSALKSDIQKAAVENTGITGKNNTKIYDVVLTAEEIAATGTKDKALSAIPVYAGGEPYSGYESNGDCSEIIIDSDDVAQYNAYLTALETAGFTCYTTNDIDGNPFATYTNDKYTVNLGYYDYENRARIIVEPLAEPTGLKEDNVYTAVTTSQVTMLGLEYINSENNPVGNGLCLLFRLADGRFIVVDGGHTTKASTWANNLLNAMKDQSKEYRKSVSDITVAAWIVTHAHGDHMGMIGSQYGVFKAIKVEEFIVNFMSENERQKAITSSEYGANYDAGEGGGYLKVYTAAAALGADIRVVHVGQKLYIADAELEVLYTIESYGPAICNAFNTTSLIIKANIAGTTVMITGDATGPAFLICSRMFKTTLKCDIVQVAHHGYTTWGTSNGTIAAYRMMAPTTLLWPQGLAAYPNYVVKDYNAVLTNKNDNPNYVETYIAGWGGDKTILPLPYTVGTGTTTRIPH